MAKYGLDKIGWSHSMKMGHRCACNGDYAASILHYLQAVHGGSDNAALVCNNLADSYMNAGQLDLAMEWAKQAIGDAQDKTLPYVTIGEIHQAKGEHKEALDYIIMAQKVFEESVPELKDMVFDSIEEVIRKLPMRIKFDLSSKDWIRIIYLVQSLRTNYQQLMDYTNRGVSWEFLSDIREKSLGQVGQKYLWSKQKLGIKGGNAAAIAKTYAAMSTITGKQKTRVTELDESRTLVQISACWECSVIKSMKLDKSDGWIACSRTCQAYINTVAKAINPRADFAFTSTLVNGDKYCEGNVEVKSS